MSFVSLNNDRLSRSNSISEPSDPLNHRTRSMDISDVALRTLAQSQFPSCKLDVTMNKVMRDDELIFFPDSDELFDETNYQKYLNQDKAQLVFSTATILDKGITRSIDLTKKAEKGTVIDEERQKKLDIEYAKIKHVLGLGGRAQKKNISAHVSISNGFITAFFPTGKKVYDLLERSEIKRLLEDVDMKNVTSEAIEKAFSTCRLAIQKMTELTATESGNKKDPYIHDYIGNPYGFDMYQGALDKLVKAKKDLRHGRTTEKLLALKLIKKDKSDRSKAKLNKNGAVAFNHVIGLNYLNQVIIKELKEGQFRKEKELKYLRAQCKHEQAEGVQRELDGIVKVIKDLSFESIQQDAMEKAILYLEGFHVISTPQWNDLLEKYNDRSKPIQGRELLNPSDALVDTFLPLDRRKDGTNPLTAREKAEKKREIRDMFLKKIALDEDAQVSQKNKTFFTRTPYETNTDEKRSSIAVALQLMHLAQDTTPVDEYGMTERLEVLQANQRLIKNTFTHKDSDGNVVPNSLFGSQTFKMPEGERFLLHAVNSLYNGSAPKKVMGTYSKLPKYVQEVLKGAMDKFVANKDDKLKFYQAGQTYESKKVGKKGIEFADNEIS